MTIFVDSSFLIALFHKTDEFHSKAYEINEKIKGNKALRLLSSNIVLAEAVNFVFRVRGPKFAKKFLNLIQKTGLEIVFVPQETFESAYNLLFKQKSKRGLNLFDCLHLATMKFLGINAILSFDRAFKKEVKVIGVD